MLKHMSLKSLLQWLCYGNLHPRKEIMTQQPITMCGTQCHKTNTVISCPSAHLPPERDHCSYCNSTAMY